MAEPCTSGLTHVSVYIKPIIFISGGSDFASNAALARVLSLTLSDKWECNHASGVYKGVKEESLMLTKNGIVTPEERKILDGMALAFRQECYLEVECAPFPPYHTTRYLTSPDGVADVKPCRVVMSLSEPYGDYTRCGYLYIQVIDEE